MASYMRLWRRFFLDSVGAAPVFPAGATLMLNDRFVPRVVICVVGVCGGGRCSSSLTGGPKRERHRSKQSSGVRFSIGVVTRRELNDSAIRIQLLGYRSTSCLSVASSCVDHTRSDGLLERCVLAGLRLISSRVWLYGLRTSLSVGSPTGVDAGDDLTLSNRAGGTL